MSNIDAQHITLEYPLLGVGNRSFKSHLLNITTGGLIISGKQTTTIQALRDVNFVLQDGDRLGLVGHNGAGKSTLLKVLAGIYKPTTGDLYVNGKVVSTLNLSIGMESEATGLDNIMIRGLLLGMTKAEIRKKLDEIIEFTDLGEYVNMPVRIYSAGMIARLAFATVTAMDADILLMDEVIGAGDAAFIEKAERRLNDFMSRSQILVLASHSEGMIRAFCNKALLLEHGQVIRFGSTDEVFDLYNNRLLSE